mgnify:CR=1 FL=1
MTTLSDARFESLRGQGFSGATSDMLLQWLQSNGATENTIPDAWKGMLEAQGYPYGQRNDKWYEFLGDLGFQGALPDRVLEFWLGGGSISPDGVRITDHPDNWSGIEGATATFTVVASSGNASPLSYQWQEYITGTGYQNMSNGGRVSGVTTATLTITPTEIGDSGRMFRCTVSNSFNTINSKSAVLNITGATWFIVNEAGVRMIDEPNVNLMVSEDST